MRRATKKNVVVIFKVCTIWFIVRKLRELKLSSVSTMNHLIDLGACALAGCTHFIILHDYFKKIFKVHFGVFKFDAT